MKGNRSTEAYRRRVLVNEGRTTWLMNVVVALAIAAVAYTDWIVVANV